MPVFRRFLGKQVARWVLSPDLFLYTRKGSNTPAAQRGDPGRSRYVGPFVCCRLRCESSIDAQTLQVIAGMPHTCGSQISRAEARDLLIYSVVYQYCYYYGDIIEQIPDAIDQIVPSYYPQREQYKTMAEEFEGLYGGELWRAIQDGLSTTYPAQDRRRDILSPDGDRLTAINPRPSIDELLAMGWLACKVLH